MILDQKAKEAEDRVKQAEKRLADLARVNIEYNNEITKLRGDIALLTATAESCKSAAILADAEARQKKQDLEVVSKDMEAKKDNLDMLVGETGIILCSARQEEQNIRAEIKKLLITRDSLLEEVDGLSKNKVSISNTILSYQPSLAENERRMKTSKDKISSIDRELADVYDKLVKMKAIYEKQISGFQSEISTLSLKADNIRSELSILEQKRMSVESEIINKKNELESLIEKKMTGISEFKARNDRDREYIMRDQESLAVKRGELLNKEKELKLIEIKLKDLARKKDIDIQIEKLSQE